MTTKLIRYINWEKEQIQEGNQVWVIPQLAANIGNHWPLTRVNGLVSPSATLKTWKNMVQENRLTLDGTTPSLDSVTKILSWLNRAPRGEVLGSGIKQTSKDGIRWSAPVPLLLSFWKEFRGVMYSEWDWKDPHMKWFVDEDILDWSKWWGVQVTWDHDDLLQFRVGALEVKSGRLQGTQRKPESCSQVYGVSDSEFKVLPRLMKLALTQLWCFHPKIRHNLMICDHMNLDQLPPPLISTDILDNQETKSTLSNSPWDL